MLHLPVPGEVELDAKGGAVGGGLLLVGATAHVRRLDIVLLARNREEQSTQKKGGLQYPRYRKPPQNMFGQA
jgi:hypothetical protein